MSGAVAVFHGVEIPETLLAGETQNHHAPTLSDARTMAGRALAAKAVLLDRARELGLQPDPERNADGQEETEEEALIRAVLSAEIDVSAASETEIEAVYLARPDAFMSPTLLEVSHILIASADETLEGFASARARAIDLIDRLRTRPEMFRHLAADHSACPSASEGGSLGQLRPGDVLENIWDTAMSLMVGEIAAEPVLTEHGWHVVRLDHRSPGARLPLDYVRPHIALQLEAKAWTKAAVRYVDELLSSSSAAPRLKLGDDGRLADGQTNLSRLDGLLGSALADIEAAYAQLPAQTRQMVEAAATREGQSAADTLARAIRSFLAAASDEAWTQVISKLRDSASPLADSLATIVAHQFPPVRKPHRLINIRSGTETTP
ncbi:MAG: peptidylprolyl isomerase [Hyphomonas sp.]|nr:peptidylprolyl isomerase [Hyphomonas sp.]